ncbi:MAG: polyprenyl synthetase family protein [Vicinamibacterales bacterium]
MTIAPTDLQAWLASRRSAVEQALERYLPTPDAARPTPGFVPASKRAPARVAESMRYSLFAGGKRLRPLLALASAEAVAEHLGTSATHADELAIPVACALEMIHTYSLVHDDLPAMDDDTMRRGRPTAHVVFGEGMAILAGDALLTEAFALMSREPAQADSVAADDLNRRKLRTLAIVADAAGAAGMVGGQAIDLAAAGPGAPPFDAVALREMHIRKTGALIVASALGGAIMAGATEPLAEAIGRYGVEIGLAFQIVDDILDVEGASAELGKTAGKDAAAGKPTYPALYGLEASRRLASECVLRATTVLHGAGLGGQLPAIAHWVVGRTN